MENGFSKWKLLALLAAAWVVADQVTKYLAVEHLTAAFVAARAHTFPDKLRAFVEQKELLERGLANPVPVTITSFWQHRYTQNRGAAWGVLSGAGEQFRVPFFYLVSIAAVIFIFSYYRKLRTEQRYLQIALALVLGGAIGNAIDRILRGYVIDFIDWHWFDPHWLRPSFHWPTFNVADSGITVGLAMLFLEMLFAKKPAKAPAEPAARKA
ncbi:MAG TPA: signal peptidase II [Myxococcales bacterium]|jgi:signal peptidase II|nr:signal peptidase II [Myxococcales bacterium]